MGKIKLVTSEKKKPTYFSMLHYWMKKKFPEGVFLVKIYTGSMQDLFHYPEVFKGFKDYDEAFDYVEEKGLLNHDSYLLKIYVDGEKSEEGDDLLRGKIPVSSKRYEYQPVDKSENNKDGEYDFIEVEDENAPCDKSYYLVFPDKSYMCLISFDAFDDVNLSYNVRDMHYGLARKWKEADKSKKRKDIIKEARFISEYSIQHEDEFKDFMKENMCSAEQVMDLAQPLMQKCLDLHMQKKGLSEDKKDPERIKEINSLIECSTMDWDYILVENEFIGCVIYNKSVEETFKLLKEKYISNLVEL